MQPRLIRLRDAPAYLGMDKNRFKAEVRPYLTEIPIGAQGVAFDRIDLDAWVDHHKQSNGRPAKRRKLWDASVRRDSLKEAQSGTLIKKSVDSAFAKALVLVASKKRKNT